MDKNVDNKSLPNLKAIIENLSNYADSHVQEMRLSIAALGLLGAGIALRSIRLATRFRDVNKIPKSFIRKNISLRGVVKSVSTDGSLNICHIPIIKMPWHSYANNDKLLNISFAAINPTVPGVYWLKLNIENKNVWFNVLSRNQNDVYCVISKEKAVIMKDNLNLLLVKKGLAFVKPYEQGLDGIKSYKNLYKQILWCEKKAQKDGAGIWYSPSKLDQFKSQLHSYIYRLKE